MTQEKHVLVWWLERSELGNEWKLKQKQAQSALWEHLAIQGKIELRKQNRRDKIWCSGTFVFECPLESPV